jgi:hypothetical protein
MKAFSSQCSYRQAIGLSPEQFIELQRINMHLQVCGPSGKSQCTFIQNDATPVYDLKH